MRPVRADWPMINRARHQPSPADPSPIGSGVSRLAERGRTSDDLRVMARRESLRQTLLLLAGAVAITAVLTLTTGGPWPALVTLPTVAVVLLLASMAASQAAWAVLTLATGVGTCSARRRYGSERPLSSACLLRRRLTWRIRRTRPRSLARCTPVWALASAGPSEASRFGMAWFSCVPVTGTVRGPLYVCTRSATTKGRQSGPRRCEHRPGRAGPRERRHNDRTCACPLRCRSAVRPMASSACRSAQPRTWSAATRCRSTR